MLSYCITRIRYDALYTYYFVQFSKFFYNLRSQILSSVHQNTVCNEHYAGNQSIVSIVSTVNIVSVVSSVAIVSIMRSI